VYTNFKGKEVRTLFESDGAQFSLVTDNGLFNHTNSGKTWKQFILEAGNEVVESNGVLMATSQKGIIRSTDGGENWDLVISEGGVGIAVEIIDGGFAAITYNTESETRRVRTSYDGGKNGSPLMLAFLLKPPSPLLFRLVITSIVVILPAFFDHQTKEKHGTATSFYRK